MTVIKIAASGGVDLEPTDRNNYVPHQESDAALVEVDKHDIDAENNDGIIESNSAEDNKPYVRSGARVTPQIFKSASIHLTRKLFLAGLASPVCVFVGCLVTGLIFFLLNLLVTGKVDFESMLGMIYGGAVYAVFVAVVSVPATLLFGLPLSYVAWKLKALSTKVVLMCATIVGGVFLVVLACIFLSRVERSLLMICLAIGASGGFVNGYAFLRLIRR